MEDLKINETVEQAIKDINVIKESMVQSGNQISSIVYSIRDELTERDASRDFALKTGMSKASISKMVTAEKLRADYAISSDVSYNTIYKVRGLFDIDNDTIMATRDLLNQLKSADVILNLLCEPGNVADDSTEDTPEDTAEETADHTPDDTPDDSEETRSEIVAQIFEILDTYDIQKDDMKFLKMLIKGLR